MKNISTNSFGEFVTIEYNGACCATDEISNLRKQCIVTASEILDQGETPVILSLPPVDVDRWIDGASSYLWHEALNLELYKIAVENGFHYIDITTPFLTRTNYKELLGSDGVQLSDAGRKLVDEIVRNDLRAMI